MLRRSYLVAGMIRKIIFQPTIITDVSTDAPIMKEEISADITGVLLAKGGRSVSIIKRNKNPLALYVFTSSKLRKQMDTNHSFWWRLRQ